jgi:hypothetical protein
MAGVERPDAGDLQSGSLRAGLNFGVRFSYGFAFLNRHNSFHNVYICSAMKA